MTAKMWAVSDYILSKVDTEVGESITNLKLQKLMYYCQGWSLAIRQADLFTDEIKAWVHGPVIPELWKAYSGYEYCAINTAKALENRTPGDKLSIAEKDLIDEVYKIYAPIPAKNLEYMTHADQPWIDARETGKKSPTMPKEEISHCFLEKLKASK